MGAPQNSAAKGERRTSSSSWGLGAIGASYAIHRSAWKVYSANFAQKLSEKPHLRAKRLAIRRLIAT
jgi:hypothetical protein